MRAFTDAGTDSWLTRVFRPWLVASASGLALGLLLLSASSEIAWEESDYLSAMPRPAVHDRADQPPLTDPFTPAVPPAADSGLDFPFAPAPESTAPAPLPPSPAANGVP